MSGGSVQRTELGSMLWLDVDTPLDIERQLESMFDGSARVVAVEVFDHPTSRWSEQRGTTIGPTVLGPEDAVYALLQQLGFDDIAEQYALGDEQPDTQPNEGEQ